jgi:LacI family transcriptional regulator
MRVDRSIGIRDIADQLGLAESTVSRALRHTGEISEVTRRKVLTAAKRLGYRPNLRVKALQSGRSHIVGVMGNILSDPDYRGRVFEGIHGRLLLDEYLTIVAYPEDSQSEEDEVALIYRLIDHRVDGLILFASGRIPSRLVEVWDMSFPLVAIDADPDEEHADFVGTDDLLGGQIAARHLLEHGHRRFIYAVEGPLREGSTGQARLEGFCAQAENVAGTSCLTVQTPSPTRGPRSCTYVAEALREHPEVTAIFAWNDYVAADVYTAARQIGRRIPDDLSVVGFGDLAIGHTAAPPLTTLEQSPHETGVAAAEMFLDRIGGSTAAPRKIRLAPRLLTRGSVTQPKSVAVSERAP